MDYRKSKDICFDQEWLYCFTFLRLNKKENKNDTRTKD
jgi:hypothetical protein